VHNEDKTNNEESTVATLTTPDGKTKITLIGTAHLSKRSNEQVTRLIQEVQPNVVMVEVDPTRLSRIGIESMEKIQVERVVSSDDIVLPTTSSDQPNRWNPFQILQDAVLEAFTRISRALLTGMYEDMSKEMTNGADKNASGGEFLAAIRAAEACPNCHTVVLGDRSSLTTIRRAATLAMQSGDPLGVLGRLQEANAEEMEHLEQRVMEELTNKNKNGEGVEPADIKVAMMEALKEDIQFRDRLFQKLEAEVPEFTMAFLKERDYIMSESIRREVMEGERDVRHVVGVVGLGHVPGMEANLEAMFLNKEIPLLTSSN
jgi:pheromone shutdown protein TraB